jgi:hypothetical protein
MQLDTHLNPMMRYCQFVNAHQVRRLQIICHMMTPNPCFPESLQKRLLKNYDMAVHFMPLKVCSIGHMECPEQQTDIEPPPQEHPIFVIARPIDVIANL